MSQMLQGQWDRVEHYCKQLWFCLDAWDDLHDCQSGVDKYVSDELKV